MLTRERLTPEERSYLILNIIYRLRLHSLAEAENKSLSTEQIDFLENQDKTINEVIQRLQAALSHKHRN